MWAIAKIAGTFLFKNWKLVLMGIAAVYIVSLYLRVDGLQADKKALMAQTSARRLALALTQRQAFLSDYVLLTDLAGFSATKAELARRTEQDEQTTRANEAAARVADATIARVRANLAIALKALHVERPACRAALGIDLDSACN